MHLRPFFVIACLCSFAAADLVARDIFVSTSGSDENAGTREKPLATIEKAWAVAGKEKAASIRLLEGEYFTPGGISIGISEGGNGDTAIVIRSDVPHKAKISGAKEVKDFRPITPAEAKPLISEDAKKKVLVADLKAQGFGSLRPLPGQFGAPGAEELFFEGKPMHAARWPNEGFVAFTEVMDAGASDPVHWVSREVYHPGSFRFPDDRPVRWDFSRGIYLHGFWCYEWADENLLAKSYNSETRELRFAVKHAYGIGNPWKKKSERNFYAIHVFEELDRPGEYYLDRKTNRLYFWPPEDIAGKSIRLSVCRAPLFSGNGISNLVLRGLVFENGCDWGVKLSGCSKVRLENCLVRNTGKGGITSSGGTDNHIVGCEVTGTGSRAISLNAGDRKSLNPGNCSVVENHLHHLGRFDWGGGRGVSIGGCGNRVANNLIHHCPTGGVSYGGNEHLLELNEVHHVCQLYSDVGVFYTGRDWASRGNVVRWNYIHSNTNNEGHGSQAIYLDDCDSGDLVKGNIVFGGVGRGVLLGGGRDNTLEGNIFMHLPKGMSVDARGPRGIVFEKPGSWNLEAKCEAVRYLSPLWKKRYPRLAAILDNEPLLPMGNVMRRNIFIACEKPFSLSKDVKEEWLTREENREWPAGQFDFIPDPASGRPLDLNRLAEIWKQVPGFEPIPVEKIGLKK